eukprot:299703_1
MLSVEPLLTKQHSEPIALPKSIKQGWLKKQSRHLGIWKRRWVVLQEDILYTYKTDNFETRPTETIYLKEQEFCIPYNEPINTFAIHSPYNTFTFEASNKTQQLEWTNILAKKINSLRNIDIDKFAVTQYINEQKNIIKRSQSVSLPCTPIHITNDITSDYKTIEIKKDINMTCRKVYSFKNIEKYINKNIKSLINNNKL